jgi:hypothetical protein
MDQLHLSTQEVTAQIEYEIRLEDESTGINDGSQEHQVSHSFLNFIDKS